MTKAIATGKLFDGLCDCYVLDDKRRVLSQRGIVALLSGGRESGNLDAYTGALPKRFGHLTAGANVAFTPSGGGRSALGRDAEFLVELCQAYAEALASGELRANQLQVAARATKLLGAFGKVGIIALVDEATGYQSIRDRFELSGYFRDELGEWQRMFQPELVAELCRLHRKPYDGGRYPRFLANDFRRIYDTVLGERAMEKLKGINSEPKFGSNHHQWLSEDAQGVLRGSLGIVHGIASGCATTRGFWAKLENHFLGKALQLDLAS